MASRKISDCHSLLCYLAMGLQSTGGASWDVVASVVLLANLGKDWRQLVDNVALQATYRPPSLHHPTASSISAAQYKVSPSQHQALRYVDLMPLVLAIGLIVFMPGHLLCSCVFQTIESLNVDEFVELSQSLFLWKASMVSEKKVL